MAQGTVQELGGNLDYDSDPGFVDPDYVADPGIF